MKLNLGCSDARRDGYINVDIAPEPGVDIVVDLNYHWPWKEDSIDEIIAFDIIEHLHDKIQTMNQMWRVLRPGGQVYIIVPTTNGVGAWQDPTHVSFWNKNSFLYYELGSAYNTRFAKSYGIKALFKVVHYGLESTFDGEKLHILLEAVKPNSHQAYNEEVQRYKETVQVSKVDIFPGRTK